MMQNLGFSGLKSLDHLRSASGTFTGSAQRAAPMSNTRGSSDSTSYGSFANVKLTAEKLVKEQAMLKTDLEMANTKLKKSTDQIRIVEAKLQQAVNENAKLKVKQAEDAKLWKGLDSKLSSTKTLCDQLTETLHHLASRTCSAEEDKKFFKQKLEQDSKAIDDFNFLATDLSAKLESAGIKINAGQQEILELRLDKEKMEKCFRDELCAMNGVIREKDLVIKQLEEVATETKKSLCALTSQLQEMQHELSVKDDNCNCLRITLKKLEEEKIALQISIQDYSQKIDKSQQEFKELKESHYCLVERLVELDKQYASASEYVVKLLTSLHTYYELVKQEKELSTRSAQKKIDKLHKEFIHITSKSNALKGENEELKSRILELQKAQEFIMVQHAEECRLSEDKSRKLESEVEALFSKKFESEKLATELGERVKILSEASSLTECQMQDLLQRVSQLELENHDLAEKLQSTSQERAKDIEALQKEIANRDQCVELLENQMNQLQIKLDEKEHLNACLSERQKQLEEQKAEIQTSLASAESKLIEARKQYDVMLEGNQLELSKHLKELSQKNDQAINDIRKKYEMEKLEIANAEKEKAEILIENIGRECEEKILKNEEAAQQCLLRLKEENSAMISKVQKDYDEKESNLQTQQKEELQRLQLQAENELREKTSSLRREHEIQLKALKLQHEDEYRKLQEEVELQKSKEEKQRALLQLQWKVMSENQVEQEANSKKDYSVSSIRMRDSHARKHHRLALTSPEVSRKDICLSGIMRTPVSNLLQKTQNHGKKVPYHEYEIQTGNGRSISKRRRTKNTAMLGDANTHKTVHTKSPTASQDVMKIVKAIGGPHPHPANIGDLFSEGSLNPYNDDPYAFD